MAKYIDADELIEYCKRQREDEWNKQVAPCSWYDAFGEFIDILYETPTADVQEVKHGEWQNKLYYPLTNSRYHTCSVCGKELKITFTDNYCPNCGAKMDEEDGK